MCTKFKSMSLAHRTKLVRKFKLCYNCLKGKHFSKDCRKFKTCSVPDSNVKHHLLLHNWVRYDNDHTATSNVTVSDTYDTATVETNNTVTKVSIHCSTGNVVKNCLGIIPVIVKSANGNKCKTYALVDDGADKTLCDERLIQILETESRPVAFR